jgi:hypothetical protein
MTSDAARPKFATTAFRWAGLYGLFIMAPLYFLRSRSLPDASAPASAIYFGFVGVVIGFQILFLIISTDPQRYRGAMLPAMIDKLAFAAPVFFLKAAGEAVDSFLPFALIDVLLLALFVVAFRRTPSRGNSARF